MMMRRKAKQKGTREEEEGSGGKEGREAQDSQGRGRRRRREQCRQMELSLQGPPPTASRQGVVLFNPTHSRSSSADRRISVPFPCSIFLGFRVQFFPWFLAFALLQPTLFESQKKSTTT